MSTSTNGEIKRNMVHYGLRSVAAIGRHWSSLCFLSPGGRTSTTTRGKDFSIDFAITQFLLFGELLTICVNQSPNFVQKKTPWARAWVAFCDFIYFMFAPKNRHKGWRIFGTPSRGGQEVQEALVCSRALPAWLVMAWAVPPSPNIGAITTMEHPPVGSIQGSRFWSPIGVVYPPV